MASDPALVESVSNKGQEIELAVQNLEDEMSNSQQQLGVLEDSLANRCVRAVDAVWCACFLFDMTDVGFLRYGYAQVLKFILAAKF